MRPASILVVDDEANIRKVLRIALTADGFDVAETRSGEEALELTGKRDFDLVLLDINMRGMSGIETCRRIRATGSKVGIVMVTVRDNEDDRVRALKSGADDYVIKPFTMRELVARMQAILRRIKFENTEGGVTLEAGELVIDFDRRKVSRAGENIRLTPKEFDLLAFLMKNEGIPLSHTRLLQTVWGADYGSEREYLRSYVRMLRKKIETDPSHPNLILTEPWVGYRFRSPS